MGSLELAPQLTAPPRLEPLEIASGMVFGRRRSPAPPDPGPSAATTTRGVLEELLLPALLRPPSLVAFSGGRDSSAILASATEVARRHGLEDPIPVTFHHPEHPRTEEADWQEATVRHLGLGEWQVITLTDELDAVGSLAGRVLRRHGLYWPPNAHGLRILLDATQGGSLLTGNGGDELLSPWVWSRVVRVRKGRARPRGRELKYVVLSFLPFPLRAALWRTRRPISLSWLRPEAQQELRRLWAERLAKFSRTWSDELEAFLLSRYLELALAAFEALARDARALLVQPFFDPRFVRAAAQFAPLEGFPTRTAAMEAHFGDLLPPAALRRPTKASFTEVLWGPLSRAFATEWDGLGIDDSLVDVDALRREWSRPVPDFRSVTPLQSAWLASASQD